jgi:hypothetical protein
MVVMFLAQIAPLAQQEPRGSVTHDLPSSRGAFSISNNTGFTIHYSVRWGNGDWDKTTIENGETYTHSYPLDSKGEAPTPYVRFDRFVDDGSRVTEHLQKVEFYEVREGGYRRNIGPGRETMYRRLNINTPNRYYFKTSPNGRELYLKEI